MAELVDARDSNSRSFGVWVRFPLRVQESGALFCYIRCMNRALFLLWSFFLVSEALAQPVFDTPTVPEMGYASDLVAGEYFAPTEASEAPQNWDFSGTPGSSVGLLEVVPAGSSPFSKSFDGAEWSTVNGDQLGFLSLAEDNMQVFGNANAANGVALPFSDPLVQWTYPLELGTSSSDDFGASITLFGQPYSLMGESSFEVDAWGSLVMPDGAEIQEVLRGVYTQFYTETYDGDTANWYLNQVVYFAPDSLLPLFYHEILDVTDLEGNMLLEVTDVAWLANGVTSIPTEEAPSAQAPFPNPVKSGDEVTWPMAQGQRWRAMALDGKVLDEGASMGSFDRISTSGWSKGLVLLMSLGSDGQPCASCPVHRVVVH